MCKVSSRVYPHTPVRNASVINIKQTVRPLQLQPGCHCAHAQQYRLIVNPQTQTQTRTRTQTCPNPNPLPNQGREKERALRAKIAARETEAAPLNLGRLPGPSTAPAERAATRAGPVLAGRPTQAPPHQGYQDGRHGHAGARARPDDGSD